MRRTALVRTANLLLKAALASGVIGLTVSFISLFAKISYHPDLLEPYPTFGVSWSGLFVTVAVIYGAIWLAWSGIMLWASSYGESEASIVLVGFVGLLMFVTYFGAAYGLACANALLDTSPRLREPVLVRSLRREGGKVNGRRGSIGIATISPVDQPARQFDLVWDSCNVKRSTPVSPFAAVRVGRGAFGVPWVELPVECRPLAVSDRPLVGDFVLGRGPAVLVILVPTEQSSSLSAAQVERRDHLLMLLDRLQQVERGWNTDMALSDAYALLSADGQAEFRAIVAPLATDDSTATSERVAEAGRRIVEADGQHRNFGYRFSIWRKAIESAGPDLPIVIIENVEKGNRAAVPCPRCTIVSADDVDKEVFGVFTGRSHPEFEDERVFLADRAGKLAFKANLSDTAQAPELAARAKVLAATK